MDPTTDVGSLFQGLVVYGPMGMLLVYFMIKDWMNSGKIIQQIESIGTVLDKVATTMEVCNRRS